MVMDMSKLAKKIMFIHRRLICTRVTGSMTNPNLISIQAVHGQGNFASICNLYFFCIWLQQCVSTLLIPPSTVKTTIVNLFQPLDGNALNLNSFSLGKLSTDSLYTEAETRREVITLITHPWPIKLPELPPHPTYLLQTQAKHNMTVLVFRLDLWGEQQLTL